MENLDSPPISAEKRRFFALFKREKRIFRNFFVFRAELRAAPSFSNFFVLLWVVSENSRSAPRRTSAKTPILRISECDLAFFRKTRFSKAFSTAGIKPHFPFDIPPDERPCELSCRAAPYTFFGKIRTFTHGFQKAVEDCIFLLIYAISARLTVYQGSDIARTHEKTKI